MGVWDKSKYWLELKIESPKSKFRLSKSWKHTGNRLQMFLTSRSANLCSVLLFLALSMLSHCHKIFLQQFRHIYPCHKIFSQQTEPRNCFRFFVIITSMKLLKTSRVAKWAVSNKTKFSNEKDHINVKFFNNS
jgi:hypothetical protein